MSAKYAVTRRKWYDAHKAQVAAYKRRWKLQHEYNLSESEEQALKIAQDFKCAICLQEVPKLHIDHDHQTNKVRGLLCGNCNRGLGVFQDSPVNLQNAIRYLQSSEDK